MSWKHKKEVKSSINLILKKVHYNNKDKIINLTPIKKNK